MTPLERTIRDFLGEPRDPGPTSRDYGVDTMKGTDQRVLFCSVDQIAIYVPTLRTCMGSRCASPQCRTALRMVCETAGIRYQRVDFAVGTTITGLLYHCGLIPTPPLPWES